MRMEALQATVTRYVCMYVCMYVYVCVYIYTYIHINNENGVTKYVCAHV